MSIYAFDLDGTLDRPELAQLANDLLAAGHEVHVVTGAQADIGEWTLEARHAKLASLGVSPSAIHRCFGLTYEEIGRKKREVCDSIGAILVFDDANSYVRQLQYGKACVLQVMNRRT